MIKRLKELRLENKLTQTELSEKLNVPMTTYANWEQGTRNPDYEILIRLADIYGCSVDYILGRTNDRSETIKKADEYSAVVVTAKNANIPAKALHEYVEFLKSQIPKKGW